jgi:predicted O-methyltransferase YrrM
MDGMNPKDQWTAVDRYLAELYVPTDPVLEAAQADSAAAALPPISVSPVQGKLLHLLARTRGARTILEIGTLGAYSTIWLARALPHMGRLITLESDEKHARVARNNLARAGLSDVVELILGRALDSLPGLVDDPRAPFDLIFIDADKPATCDYFEWALKLSRPGTLIIVDNVVRSGAVIDSASADAAVQGVRRFHQRLANESRVSGTAIQTVGCKGYDGFTVALVLAA